MEKTIAKPKEFIYIVQASLEPTKCKIGKTNDLKRRLKEYNNMTGKSKENIYQYLFTCEVKNMLTVENAIKAEYIRLREEKSKEIYFFNQELFKDYVNFISSHKLFKKEIFIQKEVKKIEVKIIKKFTPTLEERGITQKDLLQKAQKQNDDEFYTRLEDVEKELNSYDINIWKNKTVFCNCDDPYSSKKQTNSSAFPIYFIKNFKRLGLKKLICTHFSGAVDLFNQGAKGYVFTKNGYKEVVDYPKNYTGSFDHELSIKILNEEADIVCTNPPFSRAVDFWNILIKSRKSFIIVSNITNPITPAFIPFFFKNKVWAGYNRIDKYLNPRRELVEAAGHWYTNIPIKKRPKHKLLKIIPLKEIPAKYKSMDDSNILLIDQGYIPKDYSKPFAISARPILNGILEKGYKLIDNKEYYPYVNGKKKFARVLIRKK